MQRHVCSRGDCDLAFSRAQAPLRPDVVGYSGYRLSGGVPQERLFAPSGSVSLFIALDGRTITDHAEITAIIGRDIKLGLPLVANVRHLFVAGDTAQIVLDWSIDGKGPDGEQVRLAGSACDIARRGADGFWRYLIDNNQGTAVRQPA